MFSWSYSYFILLYFYHFYARFLIVSDYTLRLRLCSLSWSFYFFIFGFKSPSFFICFSTCSILPKRIFYETERSRPLLKPLTVYVTTYNSLGNVPVRSLILLFTCLSVASSMVPKNLPNLIPGMISLTFLC